MLQIKMVRVAQAVEFEGAMRTFFLGYKYAAGRSTKMSNVPVVDVEECEEGVIIRSGKDIVKIFRTNIAYISYEEVEQLTTSATKKTEKSAEKSK